MSRENIATIVKIIESFSDEQQERIIEHLREYIANFQDELQWDKSFEKTQGKLVTAARKAKQQIAEGKGQPMDYDKL
ncbi:MAG: hypothetical protein F6K17_42055 [Okeania sp. SIO3C4]|nr:hypothetical protein [Okeania sp. SIO3B3]NER08652.1 hypothetical protein [Okeania sp. SIO3C4]